MFILSLTYDNSLLIHGSSFLPRNPYSHLVISITISLSLLLYISHFSPRLLETSVLLFSIPLFSFPSPPISLFAQLSLPSSSFSSLVSFSLSLSSSSSSSSSSSPSSASSFYIPLSVPFPASSCDTPKKTEGHILPSSSRRYVKLDTHWEIPLPSR
ncbi:hypothetical protein E2C01_011979 [Portunus trituberculatus]|uniref:Uncharacterized protein n=1 Tax=Portunus trituberculatus TaxID=210409 RepID=A0A5B7DCP9_PORTR|nr:hypothetical protein [Portunus trituberculatus]